MTFIKKIFTNNIDDEVHKSFTRFSKGTFENRAVTKITKIKENIKVYFSYDLIKDIIKVIADNIETAEVSGKIIKARKKKEISATVSSEELKKICEENEFILLDISSSNIEFKCKKALPKPGKALNPKFASATLPIGMASEFLFDHPENFKQAIITHTFYITDMVIPDQYKNNPELARVNAKRKGKIKRIVDIDGKHEEKEIDITV